MRTTINLDDDLLALASKLTGITDRTPLIRESLTLERKAANGLSSHSLHWAGNNRLT